jgi:hypothetical protein
MGTTDGTEQQEIDYSGRFGGLLFADGLGYIGRGTITVGPHHIAYLGGKTFSLMIGVLLLIFLVVFLNIFGVLFYVLLKRFLTSKADNHFPLRHVHTVYPLGQPHLCGRGGGWHGADLMRRRHVPGYFTPAGSSEADAA